MSAAPLISRFGPSYTPAVVRAIANCTAAISALDARVSVSPVARPWRMRASWSGYTAALKLQGAEIDEIDVFSWGCGIKLPERPLISTTLDPFDAFAPWQGRLAVEQGPGWRDHLPTAIGEGAEAAEHPPLVRALDLLRQRARVDASIQAWLAAPLMLAGLKLTGTPLPCLVGGVKAFRLKRSLAEADWVVALNGLADAARTALERLEDLELQHRRGLRALVGEYRPGALPRLLALAQARPILSPQSTAKALGLSVAGASKLIDRAVATELLVEVTKRKTWKAFLTPDLAILFGFVAPRRGRPRSDPPALPANREMAGVLDAFDREMAEIDALLAGGAGSDRLDA